MGAGLNNSVARLMEFLMRNLLVFHWDKKQLISLSRGFIVVDISLLVLTAS